MEPTPPQPGLWSLVDDLQKQLTLIQGSLTNSQEKQMMGMVLEGIQNSRKEVQELLSPYVEELKQRVEKGKADMEELGPRLEKEIEQEAAAKKEQAAKRKEKVERAPKATTKGMETAGLAAGLGVGAGLAATALGAELLSKLGPLQQPASALPEDLDSLWRHMDERRQPEPEMPVPPPAEPVAGPKEPVTPSQDLPGDHDASLREFFKYIPKDKDKDDEN